MKLPEMCGVLPRTAGATLVFIGCDSRYAARHAIPLLYSLDQNGGDDLAAHVHVVNPQGDIEAALAVVACDLGRTSLTVTWEAVDLSPTDAEARATYYACIRFVRAVQTMHATGRPILALDADSLVRKRLDLPVAEAGLFLRPDHPRHMRVAAGAVMFTPAGRTFATAVANGIGQVLAEWLAGGRGIGWYLDQQVLTEACATFRPKVHQFDRAFLDWEFGDGSTIWTGKGARKHDNQAYQAEHSLYAGRFTVEGVRARRWRGGDRRALILLPCLDLPFKRPRGCVQREQATSELRCHWRRFAQAMQGALIESGWEAKIVARPGWEITPKFVDFWGADLVLVPHRERHQFDCTTPALFWMQTPIPHLFTVDVQGWGAGAEGYPFDHAAGEASSGTYDELRARIEANASKFDQPPRRSRPELIAAGVILDAPYVFFPCQLPHDETVRLHSEIDETELVRRLGAWASASRVPLVLKAHPANPASMAPLREAAGSSRYVRWVEADAASIHDLIENAAVVYTINSGTGLEAILHGKPVVTFGRAEYDGVAIRGDPRRLEAGWSDACDWAPQSEVRRYRSFIDWFVNRHAFDSRPHRFDAPRFMSKAEAVARAPAEAA